MDLRLRQHPKAVNIFITGATLKYLQDIEINLFKSMELRLNLFFFQPLNGAQALECGNQGVE